MSVPRKVRNSSTSTAMIPKAATRTRRSRRLFLDGFSTSRVPGVSRNTRSTSAAPFSTLAASGPSSRSAIG